MKLKKILNLIVMVLLVTSSLLLASCTSKLPGTPTGVGGGNNGGGNSGGGNSGGDNGGGTVTPPPVTPGEGKKLHELFEKFKIVSDSNSALVIDPTTGNELVDFNYLLERQIHVFADELLYRIVSVYGAGVSTTTSYTLKDVNGNDYRYGSDFASVSTDSIIDRKYTQYGNVRFLSSTGQLISSNDINNILDPATYAASFYTTQGTWNGGGILQGQFLLKNTIGGGYEYINDGMFAGFNKNTLFDNTKEKFEWNWGYSRILLNNPSASINDDTAGSELYSLYKNEYLEEFKLTIANILATGSHLGGYTEINNELLSKIGYIGFKQADIEKIQNFIYDVVIGTNQFGESIVYNDNLLLQSITDPITGFTDGLLTTENIETIENEEHYFKAYSILIPKLIERTLTNTFGDDDIDLIVRNSEGDIELDEFGKVIRKSPFEIKNEENGLKLLYPRMLRASQEDIIIPTQDYPDNELPQIQMTAPNSIRSIILQPTKSQDTEVSLLELWMAIGAVANLGNNQISSNVKVKFEVNIKYVADGAVYLNEKVSSFTNTTTNNKSVFEIEGLYDTSDKFAGKGINWFFDLNISDHLKPINGVYTAIDNSGKTSTKYPVMKAYDGIDVSLNDYNLWSSNNPFNINGYNAGSNNYVELSFNILEAHLINGSTLTPISKSDVMFTIGFSDPWF